MSKRNSRDGKARRAERQERQLEPPPHIKKMAEQSQCPDCDSEVVLLHRRGDDDETWFCEIHHDTECPQLAWRERTGAGPSFMLAGKDGEPLPPESVTRSLEILAEHGLVPGRIAASTDGSVPPAPSWEERELIEQAVREMRGDAP